MDRYELMEILNSFHELIKDHRRLMNKLYENQKEIHNTLANHREGLEVFKNNFTVFNNRTTSLEKVVYPLRNTDNLGRKQDVN